MRSFVNSLILVVCSFHSISSQQVRPLPTPIINIQCNRASILRTTGLVPPPQNQQIPQTCTYTIHAINLQICQIRLDFTRFSLAQPVVTSDSNGNAYPRCTDNYLQVGNFILCGENSGQHIYVPINPRIVAERQLKIQIVTNGNGMMNSRPDWNIAVHQFECPFGQSRSENRIVQASDIESDLLNRVPRTLISDWLAPAGCLQYHADTRGGPIETFNFNNGLGPYLGMQNYAICFRRARGSTALKLTRTFFQLGITNPDTSIDGLNDECFESGLSTPGRSEDFLFIPHATVELPASSDPNAPPSNGPRTVRATRFCGSSLTKATTAVTSTPPGPFSIQFNSDDQYYPGIEIGFRFQYEIV